MRLSRRALCCGGVAGGALGVLMRLTRRVGSTPSARRAEGPLVLLGRVWPGGEAAAFDDGAVLLDSNGVVRAVGPAATLTLPTEARRIGGAGCWVGPGVVDAHVHLAFGEPDEGLRGGVVGVRDLGAPPARAAQWRTPTDGVAGNGAAGDGAARVSVAGPMLTAPGGYPSTSWGADGFAAFITSPEQAQATVRALAADGVDLVKVALEAGGGRPVPSLAEVRAVVEAAHAAGLPVTAHALDVAMVTRALDAGVDELCHTPTELLPEVVVDRIAETGMSVVSTIQTLCVAGDGSSDGDGFLADGGSAPRNAAALVRAGVPLVYGTDLGNAGTRPGVDPRELERLAAAGLGRLGALRAATEGSAGALGAPGLSGRIEVGEQAALVVLPEDPLVEPAAWLRPVAVLVAGGLVEPVGP